MLDWWRWRIRPKIRGYYFNVYYGIRNLIRWLPIIWCDRDWDHVYLLKILEKKIGSMAYSAKTYWCWDGADKQAKVLERLHNDLYFALYACEKLTCDEDCPGCEIVQPMQYKLAKLAMVKIGIKHPLWWD